MPDIPGDETSETLTGSVDNDTITGLGGDDLLISGLGLDIIHGGAGFDTLVVDFTEITDKIVMTKPVDTGPQRAGTGQPAPGGSSFVEAFGEDSRSYAITYSGIDTSQAEDIWLVAGASGLQSGSLSNADMTVTFEGTYSFVFNGNNYQIDYSISGTVSEGIWKLAGDDLGGEGFAAVEVLDDSFTINYALTVDLPPELAPFFSLFAESFEDEVAPYLRGQFFYDDAGVSGTISDGTNSVDYDDIEAFVIHAGAGGSRLYGAAGDDIFHAGSGVDVVTGGKGADTFVLETLNAAARKADRLTDFSKADLDTIDLSSIDAITGNEIENDAFKLLREGRDFKRAGDLAWSYEGRGKDAVTVIEGNLDKDAKAEFIIELDGKIRLTADCFEL